MKPFLWIWWSFPGPVASNECFRKSRKTYFVFSYRGAAVKVLWVILGIVVIVGAAVLFWPERCAPEIKKCEPGSGIPEGREAEYSAGLEPTQCERPVLYTLHTCRHCIRLKEYLATRSVFVQEVYLDDFEGTARQSLLTTLRRYNPRGSFPTLVLPDGRCVVGFQEAMVKKLFGWED